MTVTVSSTTGTQEDCQEAADYGMKSASTAEPAVEHPEVEQTESGAEPETARHEEDESEPEEHEEEPEEEEEEPEAAERPVGKSRRKLLRRLSRLHSENLTLQERLEEAEAKLRGGDKQQPAQAASQEKPNPKDYRNYEEYIEALTDWKIKQRDQAQAQEAQANYLKSIFDDYNQQVEVAREAHEDFDQVVNTSAQVPMIAINAMYELENGAEVAYYLAKHSDVREQLLEWNEPGVRGGVRKILATLDHLSEELSGSKPPSRSNGNAPVRQRPVTAAPAPIRPVGGGASTRSTADPSKMPYPEYVKWYQQKYGKRR